METHSHIALYPDDPRYESDVLFYIGVSIGVSLMLVFCLSTPIYTHDIHMYSRCKKQTET